MLNYNGVGIVLLTKMSIAGDKKRTDANTELDYLGGDVRIAFWEWRGDAQGGRVACWKGKIFSRFLFL